MGSSVAAILGFSLAACVSLAASFVLVSRLERLAGRWRLSEAMLGLLVALAADSPEITSAVTASIRHQSTIGSGVVFGSNVFNLAALLGLSAIVAGRIGLHRRVVLLDGVYATWTALVSVVVISMHLDAFLGLLLVMLVIAPYLAISASWTRSALTSRLPVCATRWLRRAVAEEELELAAAIQPGVRGRFDVPVVVMTVLIVVGASALMERTATTVGKHFGLSQLVVGGIVLAAITSLPNAVGAVFLAARGRGAALLSEAMNSNMLNVVAGLLLPGIFLGLGSGTSNELGAVWYAGLTIACLLLAFAYKGLSRAGGTAIVACYVAFVVVASTR